MLTKSANNLPKKLSDHELHIEVEKKAGAEKTATLELLEYLHEIDLRRVYALWAIQVFGNMYANI